MNTGSSAAAARRDTDGRRVAHVVPPGIPRRAPDDFGARASHAEHFDRRIDPLEGGVDPLLQRQALPRLIPVSAVIPAAPRSRRCARRAPPGRRRRTTECTPPFRAQASFANASSGTAGG